MAAVIAAVEAKARNCLDASPSPGINFLVKPSRRFKPVSARAAKSFVITLPIARTGAVSLSIAVKMDGMIKAAANCYFLGIKASLLSLSFFTSSYHVSIPSWSRSS
jgi:hypothetical protein